VKNTVIQKDLRASDCVILHLHSKQDFFKSMESLKGHSGKKKKKNAYFL